MISGRRWSLVGLGVAVLIATPLAVRAIPPRDSDISAADLLARIELSKTASFSGYAESLGTLQLPITDRFSDVGDLFGQRTRMRVWWGDADNWRLDKVLPTGEVDTYHRPGSLMTWDYERDEVTVSPDPTVRLPRVSDMLPPQVAYRMLEDAAAGEVARLPSARVAGQAAPGLRLTPADARSSIAHVDVWADESSGVPLRVEVYGEDSDNAAVSSEFMQFSADTPDRGDLEAPTPPHADYHRDRFIDFADAANHFAPIEAPQSLLGLPQSSDLPVDGVGVYGTGPTRLVAIPLWEGSAGPLRRQVSLTPGSRRVAGGGIALDVGPLHVLVTNVGDGGGWLIAGTVTDATLLDAADVVHNYFVLSD
jgi:hypothetical protein